MIPRQWYNRLQLPHHWAVVILRLKAILILNWHVKYLWQELALGISLCTKTGWNSLILWAATRLVHSRPALALAEALRVVFWDLFLLGARVDELLPMEAKWGSSLLRCNLVLLHSNVNKINNKQKFNYPSFLNNTNYKIITHSIYQS